MPDDLIHFGQAEETMRPVRPSFLQQNLKARVSVFLKFKVVSKPGLFRPGFVQEGKL